LVTATRTAPKRITCFSFAAFDSVTANPPTRTGETFRTFAVLSGLEFDGLLRGEKRMSVLEQLLFAVFGISFFTAALLLSDPQFGLNAAPQRPAEYTLQSCR
jgi:hypothetical protein